MKLTSELLNELPLRPSGLREIDYPYSFPAPPTLTTTTEPAAETPTSQASSGSESSMSAYELGWFYYLAEIQICRIMDRETSLMFPPEGYQPWLDNITHFIDQAQKSDEQLRMWYVPPGNFLPPLSPVIFVCDPYIVLVRPKTHHAMPQPPSWLLC